MKYDIFISYRRDGGEVTARILRDSLTQRGYKVFFDVESLRSGAFNTKLYSVIDECKDFVLVLSPKALDRCADSDDWVRREVEYALEKKKNVIPILLRNFEFPAALPDSLKELPYRNGLAANLEYYDAFLNKLEAFLTTRKSLWYRLKSMRWSVKTAVVILLMAVLLAGSALVVSLMNMFPRTAEQINVTEEVISNIGYNLSCLDIMADAHEDMLQAAEDAILTGEESIRTYRFSSYYNTFENVDLIKGKPTEAMLERVAETPISVAEITAMYGMLETFRTECINALEYMEYMTGEDCVLTDSEKLQIVGLYQEYLQQTLAWFAYCTNEMLLPVNNERHLEVFWKETLPYLGSIPLSEKTWSRDKDALIEAGNECYENMEDILAELGSIVGNSNMALREQQADTVQELVDAHYTRERSEKIVDYMSREWEAELTETYLRQGCSPAEAKEKAVKEAEQRAWELDVMLKLSARLTDEVDIIWEKMTYLLDLGMYEEAEECISLYQTKMTNSDRYMPALVLFAELLQKETLDYGIMVMEYYTDDGINEQLMIGDIIYGFNGEPCRTVADYLAMKAALAEDSYTVKLLRLDEAYQIQVLELTLTADSPRVYINDLTPVTEE